MRTIPDDLAAQIAAHEYICGSDECGYGSWAGPLIVCAAITPRWWSDDRVTDSKALTAKKRREIAPWLKSSFPNYIVRVDSDEIDRVGVGKALLKAHAQAIQGALDYCKKYGPPPLVIIDGSKSVLGAVALPKADLLIPAVSAASIIGKVHHDEIMQELHEKYPNYGFKTNMGYRSAVHEAGLKEFGVSPVHRMSYSPMSDMRQDTGTPAQDLLALVAEIDSQ